MRRVCFGFLAAVLSLVSIPAFLRAQSITAGPTTLDALNDTAMIALESCQPRGPCVRFPYVGIAVTGGLTFTGALMMEYSTDNQVTWDERFMFNGDNWVAFDVLPHAEEDLRVYCVLINPSDTHVRLRALTYTSGSVIVTLRANASVHSCNGLAAAAGAWQMDTVLLDGINDAVEVPVGYRQNAGFFVNTGTLTGTLVVEGSPDSHGNALWNNAVFLSGLTYYAAGLAVTNPNANLAIVVPQNPGYQRYRLRVSAYTSGNAVARGRASHASNDLITLVTASTTVNSITNVASGTADADAAIAAAAFLRLCGIAIKESAGTPAAAVVSLVHGATVGGGTQIAGFEYDLAANEEVVEWFGPDCIAVASGVSVDRVSGTTKLTLFHKTVP